MLLSSLKKLWERWIYQMAIRKIYTGRGKRGALRWNGFILPAQVANQKAEFSYACRLLEPAIQLFRERLSKKSARDNLERYCGLFWVHCSSKKFGRMAREAMDVCLRLLKESNKTRFDSYSVSYRVFIISHLNFRDCPVHNFFPQPFS